MPYVNRNANGSILSIASSMDESHTEYLATTSNEVVDYLSKSGETQLAKNALIESDKDFARATEDLINLLISKNIILFTELPEAVQQKLLSREKIRHSLNGTIDNFLDDGESI